MFHGGITADEYYNYHIDNKHLRGKLQLQQYLAALPSDIHELNISECELEEFPDLSHFTSLKYINCSGNRLSCLPAFLSKLTTLEKLLCHQNQLTSLDDVLPDSLLFLVCDHNNLYQLPARLPPKLQFLRCTNNLFLRSLCIELGASMTYLDCSECALTCLPLMRDCTQMNYLYLSYNPSLHVLPDIAHLTHLQHFYCSSTGITALPKLSAGIKFLSCKENQLTSVDEIDDCPLLETFCCDCNRIQRLPSFQKNPNLKNLDCANNRLTELPSTMGNLTNLQILRCPVNNIKELPASIWKCKNLTFLDVSYNRLQDIPVLPPNVYYMNAANNQLQAFPKWSTLEEHFWVVAPNPITDALAVREPPPNPRKCAKILHQFKERFYLQKCKKRLSRWFLKSQEKQIKEKYHPKHLFTFLIDNNIDNDNYEALENWITKTWQ